MNVTSRTAFDSNSALFKITLIFIATFALTGVKYGRRRETIVLYFKNSLSKHGSHSFYVFMLFKYFYLFKYAASCHQIQKKLFCPEHFTDNIERKYFCSALKRRLSNNVIYSRDNSFGAAAVSLKS